MKSQLAFSLIQAAARPPRHCSGIDFLNIYQEGNKTLLVRDHTVTSRRFPIQHFDVSRMRKSFYTLVIGDN